MVTWYRGEVRLMVNAEKHGSQFPEFEALLDAGDNNKNTTDDDYMAPDIRRRRQGRRRSRVGVALLADNEIIGRPN